MIPLGTLAVAGAQMAGSYDLLATEILTGSQVSVTFSGLSAYASTYKHLQVRMGICHPTGTENVGMFFNGTRGGQYFSQTVYGYANNADMYSTSSISADDIRYFYAPAAPALGAFIVDIFNPFSSTKVTSAKIMGGEYSRLKLVSGVWNNTSAVSSITFSIVDSAASQMFAAGSRFSIYGLKVAQ